MKNKGLWLLLGFSLVILGLSAIFLQVVGVRWAFLSLLDQPGRLFAVVAKVIMVMAGFAIIALANTDWERDRRESGGNDRQR